MPYGGGVTSLSDSQFVRQAMPDRLVRGAPISALNNAEQARHATTSLAILRAIPRR